MPPVTPASTTLTNAIAANDVDVTFGSTASMVVGSSVVIGREIGKVQAIISSTIARILRGREGTQAKAHAAGVPVYIFGLSGGYAFDAFADRVSVQGYTGNLKAPTLPVNTEWEDPDTGKVYKCVDCGAGFQVGEWVVIDGSGLATQLAIGSKGFVGIVVETVGGSDTLAWVLIVGEFASALLDSDVTTAMQLGAAAGFAAPFDSTNHVLIERAVCTVAPSTATSPTVGDGIGTVLINRPFVSGVATFVS